MHHFTWGSILVAHSGSRWFRDIEFKLIKRPTLVCCYPSSKAFPSAKKSGLGMKLSNFSKNSEMKRFFTKKLKKTCKKVCSLKLIKFYREGQKNREKPFHVARPFCQFLIFPISHWSESLEEIMLEAKVWTRKMLKLLIIENYLSPRVFSIGA